MPKQNTEAIRIQPVSNGGFIVSLDRPDRFVSDMGVENTFAFEGLDSMRAWLTKRFAPAPEPAIPAEQPTKEETPAP